MSENIRELRAKVAEGQEAKFLLQQLWFSLSADAQDWTPVKMRERVEAMISDVP